MKETEYTPSPEYSVRQTCRSCDAGGMETILDMGNHILPAFSEDTKEIRVPLELCLCGNCNLLQLRHTTRPNLLWNEGYGYRSGVNEAIKADLREIAGEVVKTVGDKSGIVVDIGANDATLLLNYPGRLFPVGFEPSKNMGHEGAVSLMQKRGTDFKMFYNFFGKTPFERAFPGQKALAITSVSMFYDLEDPNQFMQDAHAILDDEGVFIIQQNYLVGMLRNRAFDNICHEHLEYYSLTSMLPLINRNGFELIDATTNNINGGSFRLFLRKAGGHVKREGGVSNALKMLTEERYIGMDTPRPYREFAEAVNQNGEEMADFIKEEVAQGKKVYVYGASTRGGTLLQHYGLDNEVLTCAVERNPSKWGKMMSTANIPIISEEQARAERPDYMLILPWFFSDVFIAREEEYLKAGGKFIVPLPKFKVVGYEDIGNNSKR